MTHSTDEPRLAQLRQWRIVKASSKPWLSVVETGAYLSRAQRLFTEQERDDIVELLARDPECGEVLEGTGGVRKVRVPLQGRGKSGGARIVYFFHNDTAPAFLLTVFAKNEKDNLSKAERNELAKFARDLKKALTRGG